MAEPNTFDLLKQRFMALMQGFDPTLSEKYWLEIVKSYAAKNRFYHNLDHLWQVLVELDQAQHLLHDKETVEWSVFYHDIVYRVRKNDNEEQSAALAVKD